MSSTKDIIKRTPKEWQNYHFEIEENLYSVKDWKAFDRRTKIGKTKITEKEFFYKYIL